MGQTATPESYFLQQSMGRRGGRGGGPLLSSMGGGHGSGELELGSVEVDVEMSWLLMFFVLYDVDKDVKYAYSIFVKHVSYILEIALCSLVMHTDHLDDLASNFDYQHINAKRRSSTKVWIEV